MAILGVGREIVFQGDSRRKEEKTKESGLFGEILEASGLAQASEDAKAQSSMTTQEMMQKIREKIEELYDKVKKGETEQSFQIGASSFTLKEWERFIARFDKVQEELEELIKEAREMMRKEMAKKENAEESADQ